MSDATSEQSSRDDAQRKRASSMSIKLAGAMTALTLGPMAALTWLAVLDWDRDRPFYFAWDNRFAWTLAIAGLASARCRNVVARWLLLGPGDLRTRATFGAALLACDWLMTALLVRVLAPEGPGGIYVAAAWTAVLSSALPFVWWTIVRARGGRDAVPGVQFFARTFGTRDLLLAFFVAGLALGAARIAFALVAPEGESVYLSLDLSPAFLQPVLLSVVFWAVDSVLRLFVLSDQACLRGSAILGGLVLVLVAISLVSAADQPANATFVIVPTFFTSYVILGVVHEATLRWFGVRAVNLRSGSG